VYYAVVDTGAEEPGYSVYTGSLGAAATVIPEAPDPITPHSREIRLPGTRAEGYDVYVVLFKDGKVSAPAKINTAEGGGDVDWIWGDPHKSFFVASNGDDAAVGTEEAPLKTVHQALNNLAAVYDEVGMTGPARGRNGNVSARSLLWVKYRCPSRLP
jgi:hypothetical protein